MTRKRKKSSIITISREVFKRTLSTKFPELSEIDLDNTFDTLSSESINLVPLKIRGKRQQDITKYLSNLIPESLSIDLLLNIQKYIVDTWVSYYNVPKEAIPLADFRFPRQPENTLRIKKLVNIATLLNTYYISNKDTNRTYTFLNFCERMIQYATPLCNSYSSFRYDKFSPQVFDAALYKVHLHLIMEFDAHPILTSLVINKFCEITHRGGDFIEKYKSNPEYYCKFMNVVTIMKDIGSVNQKPFIEIPFNSQRKLLNLWVKSNLDMYLEIKKVKSFKDTDELVQLGYISGIHSTSRENSIKRFKSYFNTLRDTNSTPTQNISRSKIGKVKVWDD